MAARVAAIPAVTLHAPPALAATAVAALRARGIAGVVAAPLDLTSAPPGGGAARPGGAGAFATPTTPGSLGDVAIRAGDELLAWAFDESPAAHAVVELGRTCARAAAAGRPVCVLAPLARGSGRIAIERAAALALPARRTAPPSRRRRRVARGRRAPRTVRRAGGAARRGDRAGRVVARRAGARARRRGRARVRRGRCSTTVTGPPTSWSTTRRTGGA